MKTFKHAKICFFLLFLVPFTHAQDILWDWESGSYTPGFQLLKEVDYSRFYPAGNVDGLNPRPIRIYLWYPAKKAAARPMLLKDYIHLAAYDFRPERLPVQLTKGLSEDDLKLLMGKRTKAVRDAIFAEGSFPLLVLGQGLYYESPLSHVILCEFLASHGYIVASCPLLGTHYRLVNLDVEDLETEVRDLEFVIGTVRRIPEIEISHLGVIGYDLGGMAGLILSMRNPGVDAFLSLDAGILFGHFSGLPNSHPHYQENNFTIPWMHITQSRFIQAFREEQGLTNLFDRKSYGDSYLVRVPTDNHGEFSSYAMFGIRSAVSGYWGPWISGSQERYLAVCQKALDFFDAYLKKESGPLARLQESAHIRDPGEGALTVEYKPGRSSRPSTDDFVHLIIEKGIDKAKPAIERTRKAFPDSVIIEEDVLNWLGYHFLYWWGREKEALEVFKLNTSLFPESANAYDSLGEAYLTSGDTESAIRCYEKSLELNPGNNNAAQRLKQLRKEKR
jgi:hypothetical protein